MIVRIPISGPLGPHEFVPLYFDPELNQWLPIVEGESYLSEFEAGEACLDYLLARWRKLQRVARLLRALCEHPGFTFESDGIDADMVRAEARALVDRMEVISIEMPRLLQEPARGDGVEVEELVLAVELDSGPAAVDADVD